MLCPVFTFLLYNLLNLIPELMQIMVIFCGPQLVKVNTIRGIGAQIVNKDSLSGLILILQSKITNQAQKQLDLFKFKVEIFQVSL